MSIKLMIVAVAVLVVAAGCKSAEEKCNAAKVSAYYAWDAYAKEEDHAVGVAEARARQSCLAVQGQPIYSQCVLAAMDGFAGGNSPRRIRDLTRGGAIRLREAVSGHVAYRVTDESEAAAAAAAEHWEACREVSP